LFDPRGIDRRVTAVLGEHAELATTWKTRLFEYCWIRAASGRYADFERLVADSLAYACGAHAVAITDAARAQLVAAFTELSPWPDAAAALHELRASGLRLAPLANYTPRMIEKLLAGAGLRQAFDAVISSDQARTFKPDPRAYALAEAAFGLPRAQIAFAAFGGWDAAGASWYGMPAFWVNRFDAAPDSLAAPVATGNDLARLAAWVSVRRT
jgi:2-haloacid dehalogenase